METTSQPFEKELLNTIKEGVTLVDFNAPWCAPCRAQNPIIKKLARRFNGQAVVTAVDIDQNRTTALKLGIHSIPTLVLFKNGKEIQRYIGLQPEAVLAEAIERAMDKA